MPNAPNCSGKAIISECSENSECSEDSENSANSECSEDFKPSANSPFCSLTPNIAIRTTKAVC